MLKSILKKLSLPIFNKLKLIKASHEYIYGNFFWAQNTFYDFQTSQVMNQVLNTGSNCIDVGCSGGDILIEMIKKAPQGKHFAFEPRTNAYDYLVKRFKKYDVSFFKCCLSNENSTSDFFVLKDDLGYSGMKKTETALTRYKEGKYEKIEVITKRLDTIIPNSLKIDFIKIDVEGAEFLVLQGGEELIKVNKPTIVFECMVSHLSSYNIEANDIFNFFEKCGLFIYGLEQFLSNKKPFSRYSFNEQVEKEFNSYFVASKENR